MTSPRQQRGRDPLAVELTTLSLLWCPKHISLSFEGVNKNKWRVNVLLIAAKKHHSKYFILAENVSDDNTLTTPQRFKPSILELSTTLDTNSPSTSEEKLVIDENPATKSIQVLVCRRRCKLSRYIALKIKQTPCISFTK